MFESLVTGIPLNRMLLLPVLPPKLFQLTWEKAPALSLGASVVLPSAASLMPIDWVVVPAYDGSAARPRAARAASVTLSRFARFIVDVLFL